ncbi:hypothetical protein CFP56_026080 [Quercus suber]|uniref:3'-5' exonuclease domain-containing protein n=1 Tax=Quercus suber TaxID=58331 RepID=A0AAW0K2L4_QUESU
MDFTWNSISVPNSYRTSVISSLTLQFIGVKGFVFQIELLGLILRKPNIEGYGLKELADEVGMHIEEPIGECPDWNAREFSMEQIKYAVHNANTSYVIVDKLLRLCEIEINGSKVKVFVADNSALVVAMINGLKDSLHERLVVGLDYNNTPTGKVLILCIGAHYCLIIKLSCLDCVPKTLKQFLADETYCFLGTGMSNIIQALQSDDIQCGTGIDDSEETNIEGYGLKELADEVGMHIEEPNGECPDWNAREFSMEQIKYAVHNAILLM